MEEIKKKVRIGVMIFAGVVCLAIIFNSIRIVEVGQRGVKTRMGVLVGVLDPGPHFKLPFVEKITKMDVQTQKEQTEADAASSDLQTVKATIAVNYNLQYDKVGDLYQRLGELYRSKVIDPSIQEVVKAVTALYTAEQLITKRAEVTEGIKSQLSQKLIENDIQVTGVSIVNFDFSTSFNEAIEAKVTDVGGQGNYLEVTPLPSSFMGIGRGGLKQNQPLAKICFVSHKNVYVTKFIIKDALVVRSIKVVLKNR